MIVNEIAKFENPLHARWRSCLYPSSASRRFVVRLLLLLLDRLGHADLR